MNKYAKFGIMIATSFIFMFGLMYLNTYSFEHVYFSKTRFYMTMIMAGAMAIIMLLYMLDMYKNKLLNIAIIAASIFMIISALFLVRSQNTVDDISWMKAMIPHHSIAILTSERANISDPRVRDLAERIIEAQRKEIEEMKELIKALENE